MTALVKVETWNEDAHYNAHTVKGIHELTCDKCRRDKAGKERNLAEQARRDKAARVRAEERAAGLMLSLFFAVVLVTGGLLLGVTTAFPFNGRHLAGLILMVGGSALAIRALWVARKRAGR